MTSRDVAAAELMRTISPRLFPWLRPSAIMMHQSAAAGSTRMISLRLFLGLKPSGMIHNVALA